jgi:PhzF family phenazine biosynthesis protein
MPSLASPGSNRFLLPLRSKEKLLELRPDFSGLLRVCRESDSIGCFVYALESEPSPYNAYARMFAPVIGVPEDKINGNSSGCLGACLSSRTPELPEVHLEVFQGMVLDAFGCVKVVAKREAQNITTYIEGTAHVTGTETIEVV